MSDVFLLNGTGELSVASSKEANMPRSKSSALPNSMSAGLIFVRSEYVELSKRLVWRFASCP